MLTTQQPWQSMVRTAHPAPCGVCCTGWGWWATQCTCSLCLRVDASLRLVRLWLERLYVVFSPCWWLCHSVVVGFPEWAYRKGDKRGFPVSNIASEATPRHVHCDRGAWKGVTQASPQSSREELDFMLEDILKSFQA